MVGDTADNFWDKEALVATYSNMNNDLFRPNTSKILELAEKLIHPKSGLHILDLASGTGNPAIGLAIAFPDSKIDASGKHSSCVCAAAKQGTLTAHRLHVQLTAKHSIHLQIWHQPCCRSCSQLQKS